MAEMRGLGGLGKMGSVMKDKPKEPKAPAEPKEPKADGGEEGSTTITHHADGTHSVDGEKMPDHLHMLAHIGHKITGDAHHMMHHDGMEMHTHGVHESGEHMPTASGGPEEAHASMDAMMGAEPKDGPSEDAEGEHQMAYGGMGA